MEASKDSGRAISGPRTRMQSALVMGEMAMALVLLVGAGLMCRTLMGLWKVTIPASIRATCPTLM